MISERVLFHDIVFEACFPVQELLEFYMKRKPNEHVKAKIKCIVTDIDDENSVNLTSKEIKVYLKNEKRDILFLGDFINIHIHCTGSVFIAELEALSKTYLLDIEENCRSFQKAGQTYFSIMEELVGYANGDVMDRSKAGNISNIKLQYNETNWAFIKRLASKTGNVIVADNKGSNPRFYLGFPFLESHHVLDIPTYKKSKNIQEMSYLQFNNHKDMLHSEYTVIQFESQELYELGDRIEFQSTLYYIAEIEYNLKQDGLMMAYTLKRKDNIFQIETINPKLTGLELEGTVLAVQKDEVKLHLTIDPSQSVNEAQWFTYGSSYTPKNEPGFYFMPQVGNKVRLYIPEETEETAIAIQTIRTDGDYNPKASDPDTKIIGSVHGHEITLNSHSVVHSSFNGRMAIHLDDDGGISITSDGNISIVAPESKNGGASVAIHGSNISMSAAVELSAQCGAASIILNDEAHLQGTMIQMNS